MISNQKKSGRRQSRRDVLDVIARAAQLAEYDGNAGVARQIRGLGTRVRGPGAGGDYTTSYSSRSGKRTARKVSGLGAGSCSGVKGGNGLGSLGGLGYCCKPEDYRGKGGNGLNGLGAWWWNPVDLVVAATTGGCTTADDFWTDGARVEEAARYYTLKYPGAVLPSRLENAIVDMDPGFCKKSSLHAYLDQNPPERNDIPATVVTESNPGDNGLGADDSGGGGGGSGSGRTRRRDQRDDEPESESDYTIPIVVGGATLVALILLMK